MSRDSAGRVVIMGQIFPSAYLGNDSIPAFAYPSQSWKRDSKKSACERHMRGNYKNQLEAKARINPFIGRQAEVNAGDDIIMGCGNPGWCSVG